MRQERAKKTINRNPLPVELHFMPTSSSWLNLVERFFRLITEKQIRRSVFTAVAALEQAVHEFIDQHNANKKSFVWTKSVAEILEKVGRAREAISIQHSV